MYLLTVGKRVDLDLHSRVNNSYSGNNPLSGLVTVSNGIQQWIVPSTGTYVLKHMEQKVDLEQIMQWVIR